MRWFIRLALIGVMILVLYPAYGYFEAGAWRKLYPNVNLPDVSVAGLKQSLPNVASSSLKDIKSKFESAVGQVNNYLQPTQAELFLVKRAIDGDTIELQNGQKVRYIGVDTPETVNSKKPVQCFGKEAFAYNKNLVEGKKIKLVKDVSETDKYSRLLRYVYLEDGKFVNLKLVKEGYAYAATYPPDVKFASIFVEAQTEARLAKAGLWSKCK